MQKTISKGLTTLKMLAAAVMLAVLGLAAGGQTPRSRAVSAPTANVAQQRYEEYRGVRLGMTVDEVRAKLGTSLIQDAEMDYFAISEKETAQIGYDSAHKVKAISVDYAGGAGAPDYRTVVGGELQTRTDGSMYQIVHYDELGFWVSYNRSPSPAGTVTITIQRMLQGK